MNQEAEMYSRNLTIVQDKHDELLKEFFKQNKELETTKKLLGEAKEIIKLANYNYHFSKDHIYEIEKRSTNEWLKQYEEMRLK